MWPDWIIRKANRRLGESSRWHWSNRSTREKLNIIILSHKGSKFNCLIQACMRCCIKHMQTAAASRRCSSNASTCYFVHPCHHIWCFPVFGDFCILVYWFFMYFLSVYVFFVCGYRLRYDSCFDFIFLPCTLCLFFFISLNPLFLLLSSVASSFCLIFLCFLLY